MDKFTFFDAPLKSFPMTIISARNDALGTAAGRVMGLTPFLNNKVTIGKYLAPRGSLESPTAFAIGNEVFSTSNTDRDPLIANLAPIVRYDYSLSFDGCIMPYMPKNPVFYFEWDYISNVSEFNDNNYVPVKMYPFCGYSPTKMSAAANNRINISSLVTRTNGAILQGDLFPPPLDKLEKSTSAGGVGNWIYITKFVLYDGDVFPRQEQDKMLAPTFFLNGSSTSLWKYYLDPQKTDRNYVNDLKIAFPFYPKSGDPNALYNYYYFPIMPPFIAFLGDVLIGTYIAPPQEPKLSEWKKYIGSTDKLMIIGFYNTTENVSLGDYYGTIKIGAGGTIDLTSHGAYNSKLAFKSVDDFINLCADWGIIATDNLDDAQNMPTDFFPDTGGGTVPDGGDSSGFPTNPIPTIPSYPDNTTDIVDLLPPNVSALSAAGVYAMTVTQSKAFLQWLMSDDFTQNISNLFNDKLSAVGDLKILPFDIAAHDPTHTIDSTTITVGNVSGNVGNYRIIDGYNTIVRGGEYTYTAYYGDFNDFDNCSYSIYIPYAGIVELNAADVVNKKLALYYAIDLVSGNGTALLYSNGVFIKSASAVMSVSVPITSTNNNQRQLNNALTALSIGNNIVNGGISSALSGSPMPLISSAINSTFNGVSAAMRNPLVTQHSGSFGNGTGLSLPQTAFLIITRKIIAMPTNYKNTVGIPATYRGKISEFTGSGFVSVTADKLDFDCTQTERDYILSALTRGIYL